MSSLILRTTAHVVIALLLLFSLFMMMRGHDAPGGGFIGALFAAGAFVVYMLAFGTGTLLRITRGVPVRRLMGIGLAVALLAAVLPLLAGRPFFTGLWIDVPVSGGRGSLALGTPMLFDLGVYLTILGATLTIIVALEEDV